MTPTSPDQRLLDRYQVYQAFGRFVAAEFINTIVLPAILSRLYSLRGRKFEDSIRSSWPFLAARILTAFLLGILPHTGVEIPFFGTNVTLVRPIFPESCEKSIELLGLKKGVSAWPCQRAKMTSAVATGSLDMQSFISIVNVQEFLTGWICLVVCHVLRHYLPKAINLGLPADAQNHNEGRPGNQEIEQGSRIKAL
ncbi:hypothetical protein M409DRAFT_54445 [Zasmidium cellare ATCC 36951]|uniref:Uncharacterized protein n=1 Tax=Zasmidium cellare ATCC 36951 TaxID=1080233 RepID=A0A6A6CJ52_ZASCE|nr:uncharacterized protein M409DRAFT_54445 [Zasmidium cellare ATCC 36951]KAF2167267.1 hypothetical protein M409DRAFT_54445 [Zasmidium cellare ATCC 36951]